MKGTKTILFLLPDCPGYFTELFYRLGQAVKAKGYRPIFALTSPFYEDFKRVRLADVGKVYHLNEFLESNIERAAYESLAIDHWSYYASYSRQHYYFGRLLNSPDVLKKTKLFFHEIIKENNVDLLFSETVSNSFLYLAHQEASVKGIPFFGLMGARIPYHYNIHLDVTSNEVLVNPEAPAEYTDTNAVLDYMKNSQFAGLFDKQYSLFSFAFAKEVLHYLLLKSYRSIETANTKFFLLKVYKVAVKRMLTDFFFSKMANVFTQDINVVDGKIYVVYPLHVYPEASTSIFAKYYDGNEYNVIRNIAFSLPENAVLVIKEHKNNVGTNTRAFYKKLKSLPNTVLLDPYFNLKDNLDKFDAVITLSSTVGFEALTKNVPVYVLGETSYQKYPGCQKINSYAELEHAVNQISKKRIVPGVKNQTFNLYSKMCFPGNFNYMDGNCLDGRNIELLLAPVFDYLEKKALNKHRNDL
jgi:hypothetical protein